MPAEPCASCAYREGCQTFSEPYNRLRSMICALGGLPFYCHQNFDWKKTDLSAMTPAQVKEFRRGAIICEGWRQAVKARADAGGFSFAKLRRRLAGRALRLINQVIQADEPEKTEAYAELGITIELLNNAAKISDRAPKVRSRRNPPRDEASERPAVPAIQ